MRTLGNVRAVRIVWASMDMRTMRTCNCKSGCRQGGEGSCRDSFRSAYYFARPATARTWATRDGVHGRIDTLCVITEPAIGLGLVLGSPQALEVLAVIICQL